MSKAHAVFVPGHTGLSIVHSFCYGKPFIALENYKNHPPEIDYLENGVNGLLLSGDIKRDCNHLAFFLKNTKLYEKTCRKAFQKAKELSIENWCKDIINAFNA
jgi:hypothetical protein